MCFFIRLKIQQCTIWANQLSFRLYNIFIMDKLGQVTLENTVALSVTCQVDQTLLAKNFTTIVNALKDLQSAQKASDQKINSLMHLQEKLNNLAGAVEKLQSNSKQATNSVKEGTNQNSTLANDLANLSKRVEKNESNIMDNIKDINLINSDLKTTRDDVEDLKRRLALMGESSGKNDKEAKNGYSLNDVASNLNKELKKNDEGMKELRERLQKAEGHIQRLDEELKKIKNKGNHENNSNYSNNSNNSNNAGNAGTGVSDQEFEDLKNSLKDKMDVINKKLSNLQNESSGHGQQINNIKNMLERHGDNSENNQNNQNISNNEGNDKVLKSLSLDISELKKRLGEVDSREQKDYKHLLDELSSLKQQLKSLKSERVDSKTSLEEENQRSHRHSSIHRDDLHDKLNDLILKVSYLEKLIAGSKNSLSDEKNPEKLPTIGRPRRRDPNMTGYHEKDRSGVGRKDLAQLKAELQVWLKGLLDNMQNRQSMESLELKIQEIRMGLDKKADAEGTKKGFAFLQNKITQLYLFLTEPDTEDAMIVRKGFNCLSCSKKVEKLRGKLGPRLNWNNMTSTNYSPPRVGYSKPMGERSIDRQDDL